MKRLIFIFATGVFLIACSTSPLQLLDPTDYLSVNNVFSSTDMSVFEGFVDKIPVNRLYKIYGTPDTIYDAYESTGEKGYDIYEYIIDGGRLDCYVNNTTNVNSKNVEFLYYEPNNEIPLDSFIIDKDLCEVVKNDECNVYYIGDSFGNFIRIRVNSYNRNKILNIAYNDCRLLPMKSATIKEISEDVRKELPIHLADIGVLKNFDFSNKHLTLDIEINENNYQVNQLLQNTPTLCEDISIFLMCDGGLIPFLDDVLLNKEASLKFNFVGKKSKKKVSKSLSLDILKKIFLHQLSNERNILAQININKCFSPHRLNDWLESNNISVNNDTLTMSWTLSLSEKDLSLIKQNYKKWAMGMLSDVDNPDTKLVYLAYKCDYYIKYHCKIKGTDEDLITYLDPDDIFLLLTNIR
ncbi:MAG: hypothetical protein MJZ36_00295 [Bacteroidaceae bacterium]|nr:hypothetical protein [Bacteroidaceae bacterium]